MEKKQSSLFWESIAFVALAITAFMFSIALLNLSLISLLMAMRYGSPGYRAKYGVIGIAGFLFLLYCINTGLLIAEYPKGVKIIMVILNSMGVFGGAYYVSESIRKSHNEEYLSRIKNNLGNGLVYGLAIIISSILIFTNFQF